MTQPSRPRFHPRNRSRLAPAAAGAALVIAVLGGLDETAASEPLLSAFSLPYPTGDGARAVAMGDVNGDGKWDVVTVTANGVPSPVSVLLGVGDGTLQAHIDYAAGPDIGAVSLADLNSDGRLDVVALSDSFLYVLLANADGSLQPAAVLANKGWRIGDVDGDGRLDLIALTGTTVSVRMGVGDGSFAPAADSPFTWGGGIRTVGDINRDGRLDLVVGLFIAGTDTTDAEEALRVMLGNGDGSFVPGAVVAGVNPDYDDYLAGVVVGDVNGDGNPDLAYGVGCSGSRDCSDFISLYTLYGNGDGTFRASGGSGGGRPLLIADLDGNGVSDVISFDRAMAVDLHQLDGSFESRPVPVYTGHVAVGDLNGDGHPDMATVNNGAAVWVLIGKGNAAFGGGFERTLTFSPAVVASGDLNGDGRTDLVALSERTDLGGDGNDGPASVLLDDGNGGLAEAGHYDVGDNPFGITLGHLNGDARLDLAVASGYPGGVWVLMGDGAGGFGAKVLVPGDPWTYDVAIGDFNGDGLGDLVALSDEGMSVLLGHGDGTFSLSSHFANVSGPVQVGDFNRDGLQDLAFGNPAAGAVSVLLADGSGGFLPRADFAIGQVAGIQTMGDLNGDGNIDLLATSSGSVSTLLGDGHGNFGSVLTTPVSLGSSGRPAIGDLNTDGAADVTFPMSGSQVGILLGANDGTFGSPVLFGTGGPYPRWVGIGDRNGDGRADVTVMNGGFMCDAGNDFQYYCGRASASVLYQNGPPSSLPPAPIPSFAAPTTWRPDSIVLGQTFTITVNLRNDGLTSDDGRLSVSFPSLIGPSDGQWVSASAAGDAPGYAEIAAGTALADSDCNAATASYLTTEYADADWRGNGIETNTVTFTVQPQAAGPFYFYVRGTMHEAGGAACEFVNGVPETGEAGYIDQQGWAVKRFAVMVSPPPAAPEPQFVGPVVTAPGWIGLGQSFSIRVAVRNEGAASDDGRIVVGFPAFTSAADSQQVTSLSAGDSPGYREIAAGAAVSDSTCQPATAPYLLVEYADADWRWLGSEIDTLTLTVRPTAVGTFYFDVRSTMHTTGGSPCQIVNAVPAAGGTATTDPLGWVVRRLAVTVVPPPPQPAFAGPVLIEPAAAILPGQTFTITATVTNSGRASGDGRIRVSFPQARAVSDTQWVSAGGGDDTPGYREIPPGSSVENSSCAAMTTSYLSVEYADDSWSGDGAETNQLVLTVKPPTSGRLYFHVWSTMRWDGAVPCTYMSAIPAGTQNSTDQEGWGVRVLWVDVLPPPPPPLFTGLVSGIPTTLTLGESFTLQASVKNAGEASYPGRISVGFTGLTSAASGDSVFSGTVGDSPGYLEHLPGSVLPDSTCQSVTISHLVVEYADASWDAGETNTFAVNISPPALGTFLIDVRCTLGGCGAVNSIPLGATVATDEQGWTVRRFAVTVVAPPGPLPPPSIAWEPITVPSSGPGPRASAAGIYDAGRHSLIVYGGQGPDYRADVWAISLGDGADWSQITPGGTTPLRRTMHSMILNPLTDQLVIFGGLYFDFLNDLTVVPLIQPWWFANPGQGTPPSARGGHAAVYDPMRNRMLVIGGYGVNLLNDVWEYSLAGNGTWRPLAPLGDPMPPRLTFGAIYDPVRDRIVMFGGDGGPFLDDVWALNLSGSDPVWEQLHPTGSAPSPRREHSAIYDPVGDRMIVYGGFDGARRGDVWALELAGTPSWSLLVSATPPPASRSGHIAIYDALRKRMVVFGGQTGPTQFSGELWALNLDLTTPVAISLVSADARPDVARLAWTVERAASLSAAVQRSLPGSNEWTELGHATPEGEDRLTFEDRSVTAGARYGYRLVVSENGRSSTSEPVWVTIPRPAILSLAGAAPNPSDGAMAIRFSLPGNQPATLELFDLRGRRVASREVGALGAGEHLVPLADRPALPAGVYLVRLTQDRRVLTAKACVVK